MKNFATKIFNYRSYTPIPFLILMLIFQEANAASLIVGFAVASIGELIRLWGVCYAGSETRTTGKVGGTYLIISGPFAYVRNPLYVGNITLYLGIGIMSMALYPYLQLLALIFFYWQYSVIISEEEKYLRKTFDADYEKYFNNVPRLIPRFTPYKNDKIEQPPFKLDAGLKSERRTLQAFSSVGIILLVLYLLGV
ncbi:MAG: isoprenylcysteine carboxylmethyltransferase family protein [Ignavibacteria bacterium]|jgi:protein-S-isoprenylcysteine O-methyltransferase Ste14